MKKTRLPKGGEYWYINFPEMEVDCCSDLRGLYHDKDYDEGNYFYTEEEAEAMAKKLRAVLDGAEVIEPMLDDDKFATEVTFDGDCKIIPPKNHLIGTIVTTDRGKIVEFIDKSKL